MNIQIEYVAQMKDAAGVANERLDLTAPATVQDAIREIARSHGGRLAELLLGADGALPPSALVFVGDEQAEWAEARELRDGERLTVLAPFAGG